VHILEVHPACALFRPPSCQEQLKTAVGRLKEKEAPIVNADLVNGCQKWQFHFSLYASKKNDKVWVSL